MIVRRRILKTLRLAHKLGFVTSCAIAFVWAISSTVTLSVLARHFGFILGSGQMVFLTGWVTIEPGVEPGIALGVDSSRWSRDTWTGRLGVVRPRVGELYAHQVGGGLPASRSSGLVVPLWLLLGVLAYTTWCIRHQALIPRGFESRWRRTARITGLVTSIGLPLLMIISAIWRVTVFGYDNGLELNCGALTLHHCWMDEGDTDMLRMASDAGMLRRPVDWSKPITTRDMLEAMGYAPRWLDAQPVQSHPIELWFAVRYQDIPPDSSQVIIPLWPFLVLAAPLTLAAHARSWNPPAHACPHCGYNLTGNVSGVCPECGTACRPAAPPAASPPIQ